MGLFGVAVSTSLQNTAASYRDYSDCSVATFVFLALENGGAF